MQLFSQKQTSGANVIRDSYLAEEREKKSSVRTKLAFELLLGMTTSVNFAYVTIVETRKIENYHSNLITGQKSDEGEGEGGI